MEMNQDPTMENQGFVHIDFVQLGSVMFDLNSDNVSPLQMIAIGEYLSTLGKSAMLEEQARMRMQASKKHIAVPRPGMPNIDPTKLK